MSEQKVLKKCPFLNDWCDEEAGKNCALGITMRKSVAGGMMQKQMCTLTALAELLSEINAKTQAPPQADQPNIILPFIGRG